VLVINNNPGNPRTNDMPGRGKAPATKITEAVKRTATTKLFLRSFETNPRTIIKIPIGITKY
jgi:hypothetical protein